MPKFQREFPKNAIWFFHPASDNAFRRAHPVGYCVLVFFGITALLLPMLLFGIVTLFLYPVPNSGFLMLGVAGCFLIGIGLFNLVAAWIGQYLGHAVTAVGIVVGSLMVAVSCLILYVPALYARFDEAMVSYYVATLIFLCIPPLYYIRFRSGVKTWLCRGKIKKHQIAKHMKGAKNFWWYAELHRRCDMGLLYPLNMAFTLLCPCFVVFALFFGWIRALVPITGALMLLVLGMTAVMEPFVSVQEKLAYYGAPFVLFRVAKSGRWDSSVLDLGMAAFAVMMAYTHCKMSLDLVLIG